MSDLRLLSTGDDIKIWDIEDFKLLKQFNPHNQNVNCAVWSHDNSVSMDYNF